MRTRLLLTILLLSLLTSAQARVRAQCECRHARSNQSFPLTVDFLSGGELSDLTNDTRFHPTGAYAVVWLGEGKNIVVELSGLFFSNPVKADQVGRKTLQGTDLGGVSWQIAPRQFSDAMQEGKALESYQGRGQAAQPSQPRVLGETYPNGQKVQDLQSFYYPNGQELSDPAASYYHNKKTRSIQGRNYYPNGQQVSSQGQYFYPNGKRLTQSASAGSEVQYLNEEGRKIDRAPSYVTVREGNWSYYFSVYNGLVNTDQFRMDYRSPEGLITLQVSGNEIQQATIR